MPPANGIHVPQPGIKWPRPAGRLPGVADSHSQGDLSSDQSNMREGSSQVNSKSFWIVHLCPRSKPEWTTTATAALATHSPAVSLAPGWPSAVSQTAGRRWRQQGQHLAPGVTKELPLLLGLGQGFEETTKPSQKGTMAHEALTLK
eukprot:EG_transcript_19908